MNYIQCNLDIKSFIYLGAWVLLFIPNFAAAQDFEPASDTPFLDVKAGASAFADIDNDGDSDFLMIGNRRIFNLPQSENYIAKLYKNDGQGNFTEVLDTPFKGLEQGEVVFADVDGDDDLDVMIIGIDYLFNAYTRLYINDGDGNFTDSSPNQFVGVYAGDLVFADVDGDNDLDVFITGSTVAFQNISNTSLYINNGSGVFTKKEETPFVDVQDSSMGAADFDLDGDIDLLVLGTTQVPGPITEAYLNDGSGNYTVASQYEFEDLTSGVISFSDIDNDGDDDLLLAGTSDGGLTPYTQLFMNNANGNFDKVENSSILALKFVSSIFFDFNNDGLMDLLMAGKNSTNIDIFAAEDKETILYKNIGNGAFEMVEDNVFPQLDFGHLANADVDGDNFEDVFIIGTIGQGVDFYSDLFLNKTVISAVSDIDNDLLTHIDIYPNPASDGTLNIQLDSDIYFGGKINVLDMLGRITNVNTKIADSNDVSLDVSELTFGYYYLVVESAVSRRIKKFSIVR